MRILGWASARLLISISVLPALESHVYAQTYGVQTIAGTTTIKDGIQASTAFLREPIAVVSDAAGSVYIADRSDNRVRKVGRDGVISTIAGTGVPGKLNDGGPAAQAQLNGPFLLAIDKSNLYIGEYTGRLVRKLDLTTGILSTVAGNGRVTPLPGDPAKALQSAMDPQGIAVDSMGNLLISDGANHRIRKVTPDGSISTLAGNGGCGDSGDNNLAVAAQLCYPTELGVDPSGNIYFVDYYNTRVRQIDPKKGLISPFLGYGFPFSDDDGFPAQETSVAYPDALAVDSTGNVYVSESGKIRYIPASSGIVRTVAGNGTLGFSGDKGSAIGAKLAFPAGIFPFANGDFLLADNGNFRIRKVTGGMIDTIAGVAIADGSTALSSLFNGPNGIAEDSAGNLYIADQFDNRIRKVTASTGTVSTVAGTGTPGSQEGRIGSPEDVAIDSKGFIYFTDTLNDRILQIQPDGTTKVFAGGTGTGYTGDGGFAKNAKLSLPRGLAIDRSDTVYFTDSGNYRVRKITTDGLIRLVAGNGKPGYSGDGGNATSAGMSPRGLAVDSDGTVYIADFDNARVRRVDPGTNNITTIAGTGTPGSAGDGGKATDAYLYTPIALAIDPQHNLLIADQYAAVLRRVNLSTGIISTVAGTGKPDTSSESGAALTTSFTPTRLFVEKAGTILVSDTYNDRIRRLTPLTARNMTLNSGDKATGTAGTSLAISVKVTDSNGYAIQGQTVSFSVTSGTAALTNANASSGIDGVAVAQVTLGATLGPVTVRADSVGLPSVTFNLIVTPPVVVTPVITAVVGQPQSTPLVTTVSKNATVLVLLAGPGPAAIRLNGASVPGSRSVVFGSPLAPPYPTNLVSTCVTVGGLSAPLFMATPNGAGILVPNVPPGPADVIVTAACGTGNDVSSAPFSVIVASASPEFTYSSHTGGNAYVTAVDTATQVPAGNPENPPAQQGEAISISAVGLGDTNPQEPIGDVPADMAGVVGAPTVTLGGNPLPPEAVTFVGLVPAATPGQYRIDITIPVDAPLGDQPVTIQIGDAVSPAGLLTIAAPATQPSPDSRRMERDEIRQLRHKRQR